MFKRFNTIYQEEAPGDGEGGSGNGGEGEEGKGEGTGDGEKGSLLPGGEGDGKLADGEFFLSEGIKGTGEIPKYYDSRRFKSVAHQAEQYVELEKKFGSFTGTPKDGYALGEDIDKEDALIVAFTEFATEGGMNQDGFDKGIQLFMEAVSAKESVNMDSELELLGDNASGRIKTVEAILKNVLDADKYEKLRFAVGNALAVELVEELVKSLRPQKLPSDGGPNPTGVTWKDIEVEMFKKHENGQLLRSVDPAHNAKVLAMQKEWGGDKEEHEVVG